MRSLAVIALALLCLTGCTTPTPAGECNDDGDCDGIAVCTEEKTCREVGCHDSTQCPIGQYCQFNTCFTGCGENQDCAAGEVCNTDIFQCEPAACEDPEIDCWTGEVCGTESQECEVPFGLCDLCADIGYTECRETLNGECQYGNTGYACHIGCDPEDTTTAGPRGFQCQIGTQKPIWWGDCGALHTPSDDTGE